MALAIPIISTFDGGGVSKAINEFKNLEGAGKKAQFAIKKAAVPAAAVLGGLAVVLGDSVKAALDDQAATNLLAIALGKSTKATDEQIKANGEFIDSLMLSTNTADDELRPAMARLSRSTKDVTKAQDLLALAVDISKGSGKSLETVTAALAKGYDGNTNALGKLGLGLDQGLIKSKDFGAITEELTKNFGGFGKAAGATTEGQLATFTLGIAELKEQIGMALIPVLDAVLPYINKFAKWAQDNPQTFMIIAGALAAIAASIVAINIAMALNPIGLIVIGVIALIAGLAIAYTKFEGFRKVVDNVFGAIKWYVNNVTIPAVNLLVDVFKKAFNGIATIWNNTIGKFSFTVPSWVPGIGGKGFSMPDIPMLAAGGIVTGPTLAMIGEAGPEAVIPLDRMSQMGGGTTVNINVNGGDPNAVVAALRTYMRQNGSIPIKTNNAF